MRTPLLPLPQPGPGRETGEVAVGVPATQAGHFRWSKLTVHLEVA
jgi:hypothetical protein